MDHSLWLLTRLRCNAAFRRWKRSLARPKGILISIVFALLFAPSVVGMVAISLVDTPTLPVGLIRRFGPVAFLALTVLTLGGTTRDTALYFAPAEVDFLFGGPYRRRQLVAYKLIVTLLGAALSALIVGLSSRVVSARFVPALVASMLVVMFVQLAQMVLALGLNLVGVVVRERAWRAAIVALVGAAALAILPSRDALLEADWRAFGLAIESSLAATVILAPFRPFVYAYTAQGWQDLLAWGGGSLAIDLALVGLVFALDAGYLEASAVASGRRLAQNRKMMGGGGTFRAGARRTGRFRFRPPAPAWWGGLGPNFWRQMVGVVGDPLRLVVIVGLVGGTCYGFAALLPRSRDALTTLIPIAATTATPLTLLLSMLLSFDFRGDVDVMETLKTLPIPPTRLALGQVLTPAILATAVQGAACLGLMAGSGSFAANWPVMLLILAFLGPANLFFFAVENLLFLWYPTRLVVGQFNGLAVVRQMLLLLAKLVAVGGAVAVVAAAGGAGYFLGGRGLAPAVVAAWGTLVGLTLALLPLLGRAFLDFDVNLDTPA